VYTITYLFDLDTINDIPESNADPSVHLTIGADTLIWGLSYGSMRSLALKRAGLEDKLVATKLPSDVYWQLQDSLPVGFLSNPIVEPHKDGGMPAMRRALFSEIKQGLIFRMCSAEPSRWVSEGKNAMTEDEISQLLNLDDEVIPRFIQHHQLVTDVFGRMYEDVAYKLTPAKMDLSFFRSQPYFQELEKVMQSLYDWAEEGYKLNGGGGAKNSKGGKKNKAVKQKQSKGKKGFS